MPSDIDPIINATWEQYQAPETVVSADFPEEPLIEAETDEDGVETIILSLEQEFAGTEFQLDLAVTVGQNLEVSSSEMLVEQLESELADDDELERLSIEPRPYQDFPGVVQRMRLRETGELLMQWLIASPDDTVFAGITYSDERLEAVGERFFSGLAIVED